MNALRSCCLRRSQTVVVMPVCCQPMLQSLGTPTCSASCQQYGLPACLLPLGHLPDPSPHHHQRLWQSCVRMRENPALPSDNPWNSPPQKAPCYCPVVLPKTPSTWSAPSEALARPQACVLPAHGSTVFLRIRELCPFKNRGVKNPSEGGPQLSPKHPMNGDDACLKLPLLLQGAAAGELLRGEQCQNRERHRVHRRVHGSHGQCLPQRCRHRPEALYPVQNAM